MGYPQLLRNYDTMRIRGAFQLMPLSFLGQGFELGYLQLVNSGKAALRINAGVYLASNPYYYNGTDADASTYTGNRSTTTSKKTSDFYGFRVALQYRIYFNTYRPDGMRIFMAPMVQYKTASIVQAKTVSVYDNQTGQSYTTSGKATLKAQAVGIALLGGIELYHNSRIMVDGYVGGGPVLPIASDSIAVDALNIRFLNPYSRGVYLHMGMSAGFTIGKLYRRKLPQ